MFYQSQWWSCASSLQIQWVKDQPYPNLDKLSPLIFLSGSLFCTVLFFLYLLVFISFSCFFPFARLPFGNFIIQYTGSRSHTHHPYISILWTKEVQDRSYYLSYIWAYVLLSSGSILVISSKDSHLIPCFEPEIEK